MHVKETAVTVTITINSLFTVGKEKGAQRMVTRLKAMISWVRKSPYFLAMLQMPIKG